MKPCGIVSLLSDFGLSDPFVGVMKGVMLARAPRLTLVDLCHGIVPQAVELAGFWLERSFRWFPPGSVHLAVVDPGVGSSRAALVARADEHFFVAPDNGLLSRVLRVARDVECYSIDTAALGWPVPSRTFHGRDVFAPAAAEIAAGLRELAGFGPALSPRLSQPPGSNGAEAGASLTGSVIAVDHFGNLITDIEQPALAKLKEPVVSLGNIERPLLSTYADAASGEILCLVNSFGTIEIACRNGNAAAQLALSVGTPVRVHSAGVARGK